MSNDYGSKIHLIASKFFVMVDFLWFSVEFFGQNDWAINFRDIFIISILSKINDYGSKIDLSLQNSLLLLLHSLKTIFGYNFKRLSSFIF